MTVGRSVLTRLWRLGLRLRFLLWQHRRHDREVVEELRGIRLKVLPGVFNPALFRVTPVFLDWLSGGLVPTGAAVLDLGTGTGVLAIAAARSAARVVAVDCNPAAVECARANVAANGVADRVEVRHGDLFDPVAGERFDLVLCNPPFLAGRPTTPLEEAFLAGDFPRRFAEGLPPRLDPAGRALVVLSTLGDEAAFGAAFAAAGLVVEVVERRDLVSEVVTLLAVQSPAAGAGSR